MDVDNENSGVVFPSEQEENKQEVALNNLSKRDWRYELSDTLGFYGNIDNAAHLMNKYVEGMAATYEIRKEQGKIDDTVEVPTPEFHAGPRGTYVNREKNRIYISIQELSDESKHDPRSKIIIEGENHDPVFDGTIEDNYVLDAAEEMTHSLDIRRNSLPNENVAYKENNDSQSVAEYDASDMEYRGLGIRVLVAQRKSMPQRTQEVLKARLKNAMEIRRTYKRPEVSLDN